LTPAEDYDARGGGVDGCTARSLDIHPSMPAPKTAPTETRDDGTLHGPGETDPVNRERKLRPRATREAVMDPGGCRSISVGFSGGDTGDLPRRDQKDERGNQAQPRVSGAGKSSSVDRTRANLVKAPSDRQGMHRPLVSAQTQARRPWHSGRRPSYGGSKRRAG
jgi:hypothetical protein